MRRPAAIRSSNARGALITACPKMLPTGTCNRQGSLHIPEPLANLVDERFRKFPVIIPAALAGGFDASSDFYRLRIMRGAELALPQPGVTKNSGLFTCAPSESRLDSLVVDVRPCCLRPTRG